MGKADGINIPENVPTTSHLHPRVVNTQPRWRRDFERNPSEKMENVHLGLYDTIVIST